MGGSNQSIINYKKELEVKNTSLEDINKQFFDMLMIKNLDIIKLKQKMENYLENVSEK